MRPNLFDLSSLLLYSYVQLPLSFVTSELAFDSPSEAHEFLQAHQVALYQNENANLKDRHWDCKNVRDTMALALSAYTKVDIKYVCALRGLALSTHC